MKILAISGSLREASFNTAIIHTIKKLENEDIQINVYSDLDKLPFFNPDLDIHTLDEDRSPLEVRALRKEVFESDALIISTPEYVFEIPGVLKNALDWLVSSSVIVDKPVAVITASTSGMGGDRANAVLTSLMKVISGMVIEKAGLSVSRVNKKFNENGEVIDPKLGNDLKNVLKEVSEYLKNSN